MRFLPSVDPAEELRDVLLIMVYLDEWRLYRPRFSVAKLKQGMKGCRRFSQLLDWIRREGSAFAN